MSNASPVDLKALRLAEISPHQACDLPEMMHIFTQIPTRRVAAQSHAGEIHTLGDFHCAAEVCDEARRGTTTCQM